LYISDLGKIDLNGVADLGLKVVRLSPPKKDLIYQVFFRYRELLSYSG